MKKPNILVILTDQQSSTMMSCDGNPWVKTPNMDSLAEIGTKFDNAYCANPVCLPSRFSLITGMYPSEVGIKSNAYKDEMSEPMPQFVIDNGLGHLLKANGYDTYYGGKEHFPCMDAKTLGFDYVSKDERLELMNTLNETLRNRNTEKPFCMFASFINPHDICLMAIRDYAIVCKDDESKWAYRAVEIGEVNKVEKSTEEFDPKVFWNELCPPLPENHEVSDDEAEAISIIAKQRPFKQHARENYTDEKWRMHRYIYSKLTEQVDAQIGGLLSTVKELGIWDDTIIIFTSDHGDLDSAHKMEHKTCLYTEATKIPLIVKDLTEKKQSCKSLVSNGLDLVPTILDYAGIKTPEYLKGHSIKACVENPDVKLRDMLKVESEFGRMAVTEDGVYHKYSVGQRAEQYYNHKSNKGQTFNQLDDKKYQDIIEKSRDFIAREG